jgi:beta-fructofuranosidase
VVVTFEVPRLVVGAEWLDPVLALDAQKLCSLRGSYVAGVVGPFGLWVLASPHL